MPTRVVSYHYEYLEYLESNNLIEKNQYLDILNKKDKQVDA